MTRCSKAGSPSHKRKQHSLADSFIPRRGMTVGNGAPIAARYVQCQNASQMERNFKSVWCAMCNKITTIHTQCNMCMHKLPHCTSNQHFGSCPRPQLRSSVDSGAMPHPEKQASLVLLSQSSTRPLHPSRENILRKHKLC